MRLTMKDKKSIIKAFADLYVNGSKLERSIILDQFVELTGYNRHYAAIVSRVSIFPT